LTNIFREFIYKINTQCLRAKKLQTNRMSLEPDILPSNLTDSIINKLKTE
jgi:hypothetical protein